MYKMHWSLTIVYEKRNNNIHQNQEIQNMYSIHVNIQ